MTERQLQDAVLEAAGVLGYLRAHFRPAFTGRGWRTPMQGDVGFPDLTLVGHGRVIFIELKAAKGKLSAEQERWIHELRDANAEAYVVYPEDWRSGRVVQLLMEQAPKRGPVRVAA